ncbi:hypothetical protein QBC32DRAFT_403392 [Pseudoneurospora amorphoporcata]|uniref:Uncharacterized protein n=1 Tax=Pseudoneurospora amorphoporcata TaxID=241081 RepID=A0AAN6P092_9PEZI|nr:hypothetical protein QBC32DRAFT_403392 [Pseudoneurospora amorphoporcata]
MKAFTNTLASLAVLAAIANAQLTFDAQGRARCTIPNGSYCAGPLLVRCAGSFALNPLNCNDVSSLCTPFLPIPENKRRKNANTRDDSFWSERPPPATTAKPPAGRRLPSAVTPPARRTAVSYAVPEPFNLAADECTPYFPATATTAPTLPPATAPTTAPTLPPPTTRPSTTGSAISTWDHHHWTKSHGPWPDWTNTAGPASASKSASASASASAAPTRGPRPGPWTKKPKPDHKTDKWETSTDCETDTVTATAAPVTVLPTKVPVPVVPPVPVPTTLVPAPNPNPNPPVVVDVPTTPRAAAEETSAADPVGGSVPAPVVTAGAPQRVKAATAGLVVVGGVAFYFF